MWRFLVGEKLRDVLILISGSFCSSGIVDFVGFWLIYIKFRDLDWFLVVIVNIFINIFNSYIFF